MREIKFTTERLILRQLEPQDVDVLLAIRNTEFVRRFNMYTPCTREQMLAEFEDKEGFVMELKSDGRVIGFLEQKPDAFRYHCPSVELAVYLGEADAGKGYFPEVLEGAKRYFFEQTDTTRLVGNIYSGNNASIRVAEKCGFRREGYLEEAIYTPDGRVFDLVLYTLSKKEYLCSRQ